MKISMITVGSTGDVRPYILLGRELQKRGHSICLCAFQNFSTMAEEEGFDFIPIKRDAMDFMNSILQQNKGGVNYIKNINKELKNLAELLIEALDQAVQESDLVVSAFFGSVSQSLAEKYNKLYVQTHFFPMDQNTVAPIASAKGYILGRWWYRLSYKIAYLFINILENTYISKNPSYGLQRKKIKTRPVYKVNGKSFPVIYAMSKYVLPKDKHWSKNMHVVGYFMDNSPSNFIPDKDLEEFLNTDKKIVYIGFGSMLSANLERYLRLSIRACKELGVKALVVQGWKGLNAKNDKDVYYAEAMPHSYIFKHVDVVIHHGGAGTFASALSQGKPSFIVPFGGDQYFNAYRAYRMGIGPKPSNPNHTSLKKFSQKLSDLLENPAYTAKAQQLASEINQENGIIKAADIIESYIKTNAN